MLDTDTLERLRHDYECTPLSIRHLCMTYGLSAHHLATLRKTHHWTARPNSIAAMRVFRAANTIAASLPDAVVAEAMAIPPDDDPPSSVAPETKGTAKPPKLRSIKRSGTTLHRDDLMKRLFRLFDAKLQEIELRIATGTSLKPAQLDAELKAFGVLIKNFDSLTDISDAAAKAARATATATADPARDDAEHLRIDLVERLHRLRQSSAAEPAAG